MTAITALANEVYGILNITEDKPQKAYNQFKKWAVSNNFNLDFRKLDSWKLVLQKLIHQEVKTEEFEPKIETEVEVLVEQTEEVVTMTLKEIKAEIKRFKEEGLTNVKLNANAKTLSEALSQLIGKTVEVA